METEIISTEESKSNRISSLIHECKCDFNENKGHGDNAQLNEENATEVMRTYDVDKKQMEYVQRRMESI